MEKELDIQEIIIKEIAYIEPAGLGKIIGGVVLGFSLLWLLPVEVMIITSIFTGRLSFTAIFVPFFFVVVIPLFAYLIGILAGYLYNFVAKRLGGLEIELK